VLYVTDAQTERDHILKNIHLDLNNAVLYTSVNLLSLVSKFNQFSQPIDYENLISHYIIQNIDAHLLHHSLWYHWRLNMHENHLDLQRILKMD
jgi:hypothetical protein